MAKTTKCDFCDTTSEEDTIKRCTHCGKKVCNSDAIECGRCGKTLCPDCSMDEMCPGCFEKSYWEDAEEEGWAEQEMDSWMKE